MKHLKQLINSGNLWLAESCGGELQEKSDLIEQIERAESSALHSETRTVPFSLPEIDQTLAEQGLVSGQIHEWFSGIGSPKSKNTSKDTTLYPPFTLLSHIAKQALTHIGEERFIVWVGKSCWPTAFVLQLCEDMVAGSSSTLLKKSLFFNTKTNLERI